MNVLVTGGAGYIGSNCVQALLNRGYEVDVFDNLSCGHANAVDKRARLFRGDLTVSGDIRNHLVKHPVDAVIHFAAKALVSESMDHPLDYFHNNIKGGLELLSAMFESGCNRIIFSSSCAIFGDAEQDLPIDEDHPRRPVNPYGESKLAFERILFWNAHSGWLRSCSLRYFNAAGASGDYGEDHLVETHLIPNILFAAVGKKNCVELYGNGKCVRDYIHVLDLVDAHIKVLESGAEGAYNLGTGSGLNVNEVVKVAKSVTGIDIKTKFMPYRVGDPEILVANPTLAKRALGWETKYDITDMIRSAWEWMLKHPDGYPKG